MRSGGSVYHPSSMASSASVWLCWGDACVWTFTVKSHKEEGDTGSSASSGGSGVWHSLFREGTPVVTCVMNRHVHGPLRLKVLLSELLERAEPPRGFARVMWMRS